MTDVAGGMAVTVRRDRRSPNVRPAGGSTACWLAIDRAGGIRGDAATFGAAVGLLVDAALEAGREG